MKPKAIIVDLDGTLCDVRHRLHHIQGEKKDWEAFHSALLNDEVRQDVLQKLVKHQTNGCLILLLTGRPHTYKDKTLGWLISLESLYFTLFMRKAGDKRTDTEVKAEIYETRIKDRFEVIKVYEDRPSVIRMWREKGLEVEDCGDGVEF